MGLFGCDYLETAGALFPEYRCKYSRQSIPARTAQDICMTSRFYDCADYKNASRCFVTTAVCLALGKPDRCEELTAMRTFRDEWLRWQPDGPALIEEYYAVAPGIVEKIDRQPDRQRIYMDIYDSYIRPCVAYAKAGRYSDCRGVYTAMVDTLKAAYCSAPAKDA